MPIETMTGIAVTTCAKSTLKYIYSSCILLMLFDKQYVVSTNSFVLWIKLQNILHIMLLNLGTSGTSTCMAHVCILSSNDAMLKIKRIGFANINYLSLSCVYSNIYVLYSNIWAVYVQDAGNAFASLLGFDMKCLCCWVWQGVHHIFWNFHIWGSVYFISMNCWWYIGCMNLWRSSYIPWIFHISGTAYFISMNCRWYIGWLAATGSALAGTSATAMGGPRNLHTFVCCLKGNKFRFATQGCKSKQSKSFIFETFKCYLHEWNSWCYICNK